MKRFVWLLVSLTMIGSLFAVVPVVNADGKSPFVSMIKNVKESVVYIKVESEVTQQSMSPFGNDDFFKYFFPQVPQTQRSVSQGSGFIFKRDDNSVYIITNNHVVGSSDSKRTITVTLADKAYFTADVVGQDPQTDIAVLKIEVEKDEDVTVVPLGDSDEIEVGDWVVAIGNPFGQLGLDRTVTVGVISAKGRSDLNFGENTTTYQDYIQTDAAINPGNSGGPLLNIKGEVIGVNAAITSPSGGNVGIGFAVPVNMVKKVSNDLLDKGKVVRAYLGIQPQDITPDLKKSFNLRDMDGVLVAKVEKNTPADDAGIKNGDVIIKFNGKPVTNVSKFRILVAQSEIDKDVPITIVRNQDERVIKVKLEELTPETIASATGESKSTDLGIEVVGLDSELATQKNIKADKGVMISKVDKDSPAAKAGLEVGDVIQEMNGTAIGNPEDFRSVAKTLSKNDNRMVQLYVISKNRSYKYVAFPLR
jgi:serine protease Do